jgi:hypothetical protein
VRTETVTTVLPAPKDEVFAYLADIENLPRWATEFARELKVVDGRHKVVNGLGEFFFELRADEGTGVIDMLAGLTESELWLFPTRVVALPTGETAFTFTMFEAPGQAEDLFEAQNAALVREFANIERDLGEASER